ncbi:MAG: hypothetical protein ACI828_002713 [Flavobacteriales bacterium]|jgi:hypothetical protein
MHPFLKLFALLCTLTAQCQSDFGKLDRLYAMPHTLYENSGMERVSNSDNIYIINDSGNANILYAVNQKEGVITQEITVSNARNKDWEDLASRDTDLFIGDFGNNGNLRDDLMIYWLSNIDSLKGAKVSAFAKAISFTLEDQVKFPPKKKDRNFDIEAFIAKGDYFYLFTRNRSSHFDGTTKCYKLPIAEGAHTATLVGTFNTGVDADDCQITGAAIDKNSGKIALLSHNKVWIIQDYIGDDFFKGSIHKIKLKHTSQKESLFFENSNSLLIGEESSKHSTGNLYRLKLN